MNSLLNFLHNNGAIIFICYILLINIISFIVCGIDKRKAIKKLRRISEKTLFSLSFLGGASLMFFGMCVFRHKTQKTSFIVLVPLMMLFQLFLLLYLELKYGFISGLIF